MNTRDIEAHVRTCGMNMKKYKKIEALVLKIVDPKKNPTEATLLTGFAKKCYGSFDDKESKKQARKFLEVLYDDLTILVKEGPAVALARASQKNKGSNKKMRIVRLNKPIDGFTKKLDCYLIGETIGKGATSVVKRGRREGDCKEEVAVKILTVDGKNFKLAELMKEVEVLRALDHKNVIKMYDCFEQVQYPGYSTKPTVVMVLELATKGELFDFFMHTGKFEAKLARWFFKQMIDGLEYCHKKKIAHRDLKPENLLMGDGFNVKLVDFGFARFFRDASTGKEVQMKTALGTPGYAAPEILNRVKYDNSVDIFSLGVILFICIAGFPPFQEAKASDWWFDKIIRRKFALFWRAHERSMKFDDEAKDILLGMLAARPAERYRWDKLRNHKWTNGETLTQRQASETLMKLKRQVDAAMAEKKKGKDIGVGNRRNLASEFDAPVLGDFLPVHHIFTNMSGKLALETVQNYIVKEMLGIAELVVTELWVGPVPAEGIRAFAMNDERLGDILQNDSELPELSVDEKGSEAKLQQEEDMAIGSLWEDLEFAVNINETEEKVKDVGDGIPVMNQAIKVRGRVVVRRHPTAKTENGKPLNVMYFKRVGSTLPRHWQQVTTNVFNGVADLMVQTNTKYFKVEDGRVDDAKVNSGEYSVTTSVVNAAVAATTAVNPFSCCTTNAAKELAN